MKIKILDRASIGYDISLDPLEALGEVESFDKTSEIDIKNRISDAEVIIINKIKITDEVLSYAPNLKLVCVFATGYDNVDVSSARKRGVGVCNVPAYSTDSVAMFTAATVLSLATRLNILSRFVKDGEYTVSGLPNRLSPTFYELKGRTWGIVGYGNIGGAVGKIAAALGCKLLVCKRTPEEGVECVDIDTLCRKSDVITLHCPLSKQTDLLINSERIKLMKKDCILVNEARGGVVDSSAVAKAIKEGKIGAYGSDVYEQEPMTADHPFNSIKHLDNVILTPHAAWAAYEARCRCLSVVCDNIKAYKNNIFLNRVDISGQN